MNVSGKLDESQERGGRGGSDEINHSLLPPGRGRGNYVSLICFKFILWKPGNES